MRHGEPGDSPSYPEERGLCEECGGAWAIRLGGSS